MRGFARSQEKIINYLRIILKYLSILRNAFTGFSLCRLELPAGRWNPVEENLSEPERERACAAAFATEDRKAVPQGLNV
jgi:hypothetical protein